MIKINVLSEEKSWTKKIKKRNLFFNDLCKYFPKEYRFANKKIFLTLLLSNNKNIKKLNKEFRNKNKHTDILSFPFNQKIKSLKEFYLGDIIISFEYMNHPKNLDSHNFKINVIKTFIHGFLHLLGYDHNDEESANNMENLEISILNSIGIDNPY